MPSMSTGQGHEVYFAPIAAAGVGADTTIVAADAAVPARKIRIFALVFFAKAAVTVTLKSGAGTSLSGAMALAANGGVSSVSSPSAHFLETAAGQAFVINTSADGVYGWCAYTVENR